MNELQNRVVTLNRKGKCQQKFCLQFLSWNYCSGSNSNPMQIGFLARIVKNFMDGIFGNLSMHSLTTRDEIVYSHHYY